MKLTFLSSVVLLASFATAQAQDLEPLPTPLTLEYLLEMPAQLSPDFMRQQARLLQTQAQQAENQSLDGLSLNLQGRLGQREFMGETQDFNLAALHIGLPLYDFGRTASFDQAWSLESNANQLQLESVEKHFRLALMRAYFNVLLADVRYRVENEAMAIAYVTLDKVQEDHAIGRASDAKLYEYEATYQQAFVKRQKAQTDLRRSRMLLANTMGRSDAVISRVDIPDFSDLPDELHRVEDYLALAVEHNHEILAAKQRFDATQYRVEGAKSGRKPVVRADAWIGQLSSYPEVREGHWHAEVSIQMPLYDGGLTKSRVDRERAQRQQTQAEVFELEQKVREQVTNLYFQLSLLGVEKQAVEAGQTYADFNLDFKRALYENELQSDLGDAMVRISQAHYDALEFELKRALLWSQMQVATGVENIRQHLEQAAD